MFLWTQRLLSFIVRAKCGSRHHLLYAPAGVRGRRWRGGLRAGAISERLG